MRVFVTGASGLVGGAVCRALLLEGCEIVALSRSAQTSRDTGMRWVVGDAAVDGDWLGEIDGSDAVVHLAGESIGDRRWTRAHKARLVASRVESTKLIARAIETCASPPAVFISASATGYYGYRGEDLLGESEPPGDDFLAHLCRDWELAARRVASDALRVVCLRFGVVLSREGGALEKMVLPFRLGVGGPIGPRARWFPWVHEADAVGLILHALSASDADENHTKLSGPVNVVAPGAVRMGEFSQTVGEVLHRPALIAVPLWLLRAPLGEFAAYVSPGQRVDCGLATQSGYRYRYAELGSALKACLK